MADSATQMKTADLPVRNSIRFRSGPVKRVFVPQHDDDRHRGPDARTVQRRIAKLRAEAECSTPLTTVEDVLIDTADVLIDLDAEAESSKTRKCSTPLSSGVLINLDCPVVLD